MHRATACCQPSAGAAAKPETLPKAKIAGTLSFVGEVQLRLLLPASVRPNGALTAAAARGLMITEQMF